MLLPEGRGGEGGREGVSLLLVPADGVSMSVQVEGKKKESRTPLDGDRLASWFSLFFFFDFQSPSPPFHIITNPNPHPSGLNFQAEIWLAWPPFFRLLVFFFLFN